MITIASASAFPTATARAGSDPDAHRMSIGEHLDELRRRFAYGLLGFACAAAACLFYGKPLASYFCRPLVDALDRAGVSPQMYIAGVGDGFGVVMQISLVCAAALSGPWTIYQLWRFVAAGLYPHERRYVTRYLPLSVGLFVGGMAFVFLLVLPWTLSFLLTFAADIPLYPGGARSAPPVVADRPLAHIPSLAGDPTTAADGDLWYDSTQQRLKMRVAGEPRVIPFGPSNLIAPHITLPEYIDLVVGMLLVFALAFQLPLVVLAVLRIGLLELSAARAARKYVYFAMVVIAAVITPGDVLTATIALLIPLCLLYELGIALHVLAERSGRRPIPG